jgi:hypothetical protein
LFILQDGYIYNKQINSLVLTVISTQNIRITWTPGKLLERDRSAQHLDGCGVQLREKIKEAADIQKWKFTTDGYIVSESKDYVNFALTSVATIIPGEDETFVANGIRINEDEPFVSFVAVCPKCPANSPLIHRQR